MIIEKISLYNFKKYRKSDIVFKRGIMGIFGNNGAGKSTIFDGITWALYGKTQATELAGLNQEDLIRDGEEQMGVELFFSLGKNKYRVSRYLDRRGVNAKLWMNNRIQATKTREVGEMIEKILGLDSKAFVASSFIRQKEIDLLSSKRPSERRGIINRLFNLKIYEKFEKSAKEKKKAEEMELKSLTGKKEILENEIKEMKTLKNKKDQMKSDFEKISKKYTKFKNILEKKEEELKILEKQKRIYDETIKKRDVFSERMNSKRSYLDSLTKDLNNIKMAEKEYNEKIPYYKEYISLKEKFKEIEQKRDRYTEIKNRLNLEESNLRTEVKNYGLNIEKAEKNIKDNLEKIKEFEEKIRKLPDIREKIMKYREKNEEIEKNEKNIEKILKKINELDQALTKYETEKSNLMNSLNEIKGVGIGKKCPLCKRELDEEHYLKLTHEYGDKIREKEEIISKIEKKRKRTLELLNEKKKYIEKLKSEIKNMETLQEMEKKLSISESEIIRLKKEIEDLRKEIDLLKKQREEFISEKNERINKIKEEMRKISFREEEYLKLKEELEEKGKIEKIISVLKEKISKKEEIENKIISLNKEIEEVAKSMQELYRIIEEKKVYAEKYEEVKGEIEEMRKLYLDLAKRYTEKSTELKTIEKKIEELESKKHELEEIKRLIRDKEDNIRKYSILSEAFVDIPVNIQNRLKPRIAFETSQLIDEMTEGKYSEIQLDEDYGILVGYDNDFYPISRFSGGERDLINLCLRIAISRVLVSLSSEHGFSHIRSLFLDEVFSSLDHERRKNLLKALYRLKNHFEQILVITHVEDIKTSVPYSIYVEEKDGYSVVRV